MNPRLAVVVGSACALALSPPATADWSPPALLPPRAYLADIESAPSGGAYLLTLDRGSSVSRLSRNARLGSPQRVEGPAPVGEFSDLVIGPAGDRAIMWLDERGCHKVGCIARPIGARWPLGQRLEAGVPLADFADTLELRTAINRRGSVLSVWEAYPRGVEASIGGRRSAFRPTQIPQALRDGSLWRVDRTSEDRFVVLITTQSERRTVLNEVVVDRFGGFGTPLTVVADLDDRFPGFNEVLTDARGRQTAIWSQRSGNSGTLRAATRRIGRPFPGHSARVGRGRYVDSAIAPSGQAAVLFTNRDKDHTTSLYVAVKGTRGGFGRPRLLSRRAAVEPVDAAVTVDAANRIHAVWRGVEAKRRSTVRTAVKRPRKRWIRGRTLMRLTHPSATCDSFFLRGAPGYTPTLGASCGGPGPRRWRLFTYR